MIDKKQLLENQLFQNRYIKPNISWYFSHLNGKRGFARIFKVPYATLMKKFYLKNTSKRGF
ncbi:hypothetical protein [Campylobacter sp. W0066.1]|uniref:hypothetical protein n=1 Tax=Campylobacter sp. W0066.1 TaxID=2735751 RepID=UPI00301D5485|nr:hypothetical protein [Campylobacter sp. W0066.1]